MNIWNTSGAVGPPDFHAMLPRANLVYASALYPQGLSQALPLEADVRAAVATLPRAPTVFDIEHWPWNLSDSAADLAETSGKFAQIVAWARDERPDLSYGIYALPRASFAVQWSAHSDVNSPHYQAFTAWNNYLADAINICDFLAPSMYIHYGRGSFANNPDIWENWVRYNLIEARRLAGAKPVYAFIWPKYHESASPPELATTWVPPDDWVYWLDLVSARSDGLFLWGGGNLFDQTDWWDATKGWFLERVGKRVA